MERFYFLLIGIIILQISKAQKSCVDTSDFKKWTEVNDARISNDGQYVTYEIANQPLGSKTLVVQKTESSWNVQFPMASSACFSPDSKTLVFKKSNDTLVVFSLIDSQYQFFPYVETFQVSTENKGHWMAFKAKGSKEKVVLYDLNNGQTREYDNVEDYHLSDDGNVLIVLTSNHINDSVRQSFFWVDVLRNSKKKIWDLDGKNIAVGSFVLDEHNKQLAFEVVDHSSDKPKKSLWYYKDDDTKARLIVDTIKKDNRLAVEKLLDFSHDGKRIFFQLSKSERAIEKDDGKSKVDIWSYVDARLQSEQLSDLSNKLYLATVNISGGEIVRLQQDDEELLQWPVPSKIGSDDFLLIAKGPYNVSISERNWNESNLRSVFVVSTKTGQRSLVNENVFYPNYTVHYTLSPTGKFVVYYDAKKKSYYSYEVLSHAVRNITKNVSTIWGNEIRETPSAYSYVRGVAAWIVGRNEVLIYDQKDIWKCDMMGENPAINITRDKSSNKNIQFCLLDNTREVDYTAHEGIILTAFNLDNKDNGFYKKVDVDSKPLLLTTGPFVYYVPDFLMGMKPLKAKDCNKYVIMRMSASESPNFFYTADFKTFRQLSSVYPEKTYNWLKSELYSWKTFDGKNCQGVLYRPENFDSSKKYPLIFTYYDKKSHELNYYQKPSYSESSIDIPWFVSNGYLVFKTDIRYVIGRTGLSAYNSVVAAAKVLSSKKFVDSKKLALMGHSFGGFETNYIITQSSLFAAAFSSAGIADVVSNYGEIWGNKGNSLSEYYELRGGRIAATLAERPELYIANSPIFKAYSVTTPLLMMNNKNDHAVPFSQGVEFFTLLRRLGKRVWMLQYDDGDHSVSQPQDKVDLTIRVKQFFDHYLKDSACPRWMMYGIPASQKGIDDGYELVREKDKNGKWLSPQEGGLLTGEEKKKAEALKKRKPVTVTIE